MVRDKFRFGGFFLAALLAAANIGQAREPLSASDWLSGSVKNPARESSAWRPGDAPPPQFGGPGGSLPVAQSAEVGVIEMSRLNPYDADWVGIVSAQRAGLPETLWQGSDTAKLRGSILQTPARLPAMVALMKRLLTAQLDPPDDTMEGTGSLFLARVDRLLDMGDLGDAEKLLVSAGFMNSEIFRRLFDVMLLKGDEAAACEIMDQTPGIAPSMSARVFCLAQSGDWAAAAIGLYGAKDLGLLDADEEKLLMHFLHDSLVDSGEQLVPAAQVTPLEFRIFEAIGQPLPTNLLPLAFAHSDLRDNAGWKSRLEAAERLSRLHAIPASRMRAIYAEQEPAASGGVWDRVEAMARLEAELSAGQPGAGLSGAFETFRQADLVGVLAAMVAEDLPASAQGDAGEIAQLLRQWQGLTPQTGLAPPRTDAADDSTAPEPSKGDALLAAMADIDAGIEGNDARAGRGIATLRNLGLTRDAELAQVQLGLIPQMRSAP